MQITPLIAEVGLAFSQPLTLILVFLFGTFWLDAKAFSKAFMLMLFTMIYNLYLKSIWQIPLPAPLEGWAFPSGHMHAAWVFWGCLVYHYKKWSLLAVFLVAMCLAAFGMIDHGYHNLRDILGAVGFGSLSLLLFYGLNRIAALKENIFVVNVIIGGLGMLFLCLMPASVQSKLHIWQAQGALMGMALAWYFLQSYKETSLKIHQRIILMVLSIGGMVAIHFSLLHPPVFLSAPLFQFVKAFLLTIWVVGAQRVLYPLCRKIG